MSLVLFARLQQVSGKTQGQRKRSSFLWVQIFKDMLFGLEDSCKILFLSLSGSFRKEDDWILRPWGQATETGNSESKVKKKDEVTMWHPRFM